MSNARRFALIGGAVVVLLIAAVVGSSLGGDDDDTTKSATVTVQGGKPVGGVQKVTFEKGGDIDLTVVSDVADEVHFHGYDVHHDVQPGGTVRFKMKADIEGRFEVELEDAKQQLAEVTVR
ncbi:MAG TPA: hypothetical protein VGM33_24915 [Baekduia sp.]|jgi:hypothetical protein